ncbi:hypothetical protein DEJ49_14840 [Streptomyces venezuelae]|uniref:DUF3817 domain-containing protein n=1 Tax=Streptomyces venezuelae TaxID=54571 RepID=A0A5P2CYR9_STRVZ|nr:hypothetical protein [Streptomyces venezuelae]QES45989.1 hypothetical protein DEJ49_14840 [Streptomyces venezuelae]
MRTLRIAAVVEAASLALLLANLLTIHARPLSGLLGPLHGTAYLVVIASTWMLPSASTAGARWRALVPGVGGLLVLRGVEVRTDSSDHAS